MVDLSSIIQKLPVCIHDALDRYRSENHMSHSLKPDRSKVTDLDLSLQYQIQDLLKEEFPDIDSWGEEEFDPAKAAELLSGQSNKACWIIDPIDGTTNLIHGIPFFCTTLSLVERNQVLAAITYDPNRQELFAVIRGQGVWINGNKVKKLKQSPATEDTVVVIDFKRLSNALKHHLNLHQPYYSQRNFGSSGIEWAWLSANRIQAYVHGSQCLWDYAAGLLMIEELGGKATTFEGKALTPLELDKKSVLACVSPKLHDFWLTFISSGLRNT